MESNELRLIANRLRQDVIEMTTEAGSGHPGGSLSAADIMAVLYFDVLSHKPSRPKWEDRDRFVLSKGHVAPVLYAALAESGYFKKSELKSLRKMGSMLQGHPVKDKVPGVEVSTGSLGQGLSMACGIALAGKLDGKDYLTYCMVGDGELQEGQNWEAMMFAAHHKLKNLIMIVDRNHLQICGNTEDVMAVDPLADKILSFGWHVIEADGHNIKEIKIAFSKAKKCAGPAAIIFDTVKGKGVSFMENNPGFHGKSCTKEECEKALAELTEATQ